MSDTLESLRHKIHGAGDLASVVRTMKAVAASSIGQYESAVASLAEYDRAVALALSAAFRADTINGVPQPSKKGSNGSIAIVFGSDQGLVGKFNDQIADFAVASLAKLTGKKTVWSVGDRAGTSLEIAGYRPVLTFDLPVSVSTITSLIGQIVAQCETQFLGGKNHELTLFHNRPKPGSVYEPVSQRLLPLDEEWERDLRERAWPTKLLPEVIGDIEPALIREYLFISLFRACAESLASENASRLAAMQRAEKNIGDLLEDLNRSFHRQRQSSIDEELFDVISGFEALNPTQNSASTN